MKSKKTQVIETLCEQLESLGLECSNKYLLAQRIIEAIEAMTQKPKKGEKPEGSQVWDAYESAVIARYKFTPPRSATTNNQAKQLVSRLGLENAIAVVQFYVAQNDAFYLRNMHPIGFCLKDCEALFGRWKTGRSLTKKAADKIESAGATLNASQSYLSRKYTQTTPEGEST